MTILEPLPRAILFDLGGVLVHVDPMRGARRLAAWTDRPEEAIVAWFCEAEPVRAYELGLIDEETLYRESREALKGRYDFSHFQSAWTDLFSPNAPMVGLLEPIAKRYPLYALSNTNAMHVAFLEARYSFFTFFKKTYYSFVLHLRKPDPTFYQEVLKDLEIPASDCVFIDDKPENVEAAARCGIRAFRYIEKTQVLPYPGGDGPIRLEAFLT